MSNYPQKTPTETMQSQVQNTFLLCALKHSVLGELGKGVKMAFVVQMYLFEVWYVYLHTVLSTKYIISTASKAIIL